MEDQEEEYEKKIFNEMIRKVRKMKAEKKFEEEKKVLWEGFKGTE